MHFLKNEWPCLAENKMDAQSDVLFEELRGNSGDIGLITLNRPGALNSLNHQMILAMYQQLQRWEQSNHIKAIVIRAAEGRAFCAGGDLKLTYERMQNHHAAMTDFFRDEYQLNRYIFHYPKPYIALLDGITMGGGVGISIHGSHRIATERLLFAMPETGIGFFPDVGGTYFLPRLPGRIGTYLGLTGARIESDDCVAIGIAHYKVNRNALSEITTAIANEKLNEHAKEQISHIIQHYALASKSSSLLENRRELDDIFSANTMETIVEKLNQSSDALCQKACIELAKKSPTSLKITLKALREGAHLDFDKCMIQEFRLVSRFLVGHDFSEGIRAVIIDKDQKPSWNPGRLEEVNESQINQYFVPLKQELI